MNARIVTGSMVASLAVFLADAPPTLAGLVTWEFTAEVGRVNDPTGVLGGAVAVGSSLTGSFTFDPTTADAEPDNPYSAFYMGALTEVSGMVGDLPFVGPGPSRNYIVVHDDVGAPYDHDGYGVRADIELVGLAPNFELDLNDTTATLFASDSLPVIPPDISGVDSATFAIFLESDTTPFGMGGVMTSLVPEPTTLGLLIAGAFILVARQRGCQAGRLSMMTTGSPPAHRRGTRNP